MKSISLAACILTLTFILAGCQLLTQPEDLGAPVPGNAGVLLMTNVQPTTVDLSWAPANDDKSKQKNLEYKIVFSQSDNIASIEGATANGSVAMDWTRDVGKSTITGLTADTDYYFNVLVRDEADNESIYVMVARKVEQPSTQGPAEAPSPGKLVLSNRKPTSLTISWAPATDDSTAQTDLEYEVFQSHKDNISTVDAAEQNGTQIMNWTVNVTSFGVTNLNTDSSYYFNVLVRDAGANTAAYTRATRTVGETTDASPVPGNGGVLSVSNLQPNFLTLSWAEATDDNTVQADLDYMVVMSNTDNIASAADANTNGTQVADWTSALSSQSVSGLTAGTTYYFNVLTRDETGNITAYVMTEVATPSSSNASPVPGNGGTISISNLQPDSLTLSWAEATDDNTAQSDLDYKVVMSTSDNIATVTNANTNGTLVADWAPAISSQSVSGLSAGSTYYFNVLTRDGSGNSAAYVMAEVTTPSSSNASPVPGNGGAISISNLGPYSLELSWARATDDNTVQSDLEYKVVMSTTDNIATISDATINGIQVADWTADMPTEPVAGLDAGTTYYFNVLVRDESGNIAAYIMNQATTVTPAVNPNPKVIWADKDKDMILSANLDGTGIDTLLSDYRVSLTTPNYLTIDQKRKKLYVSDWGADRIIRMNIDGSDPEVVISSPDVDGPVGMGFDNTGDRLFFLDQYTDRIQRSAPDGSLIEQIVTGILNTGYGMAVDGDAHQIYWTDWGDTLIYKASLAGTGVKTILGASSGIIRPLGLVFDHQNRKIYFTDGVNQSVYRANADGSDLEAVISTGLNFPIDCAIDPVAGKLYWADANNKQIERSNLDGTNREVLIDMSGTVASPYAVIIWNPSK